MEREFLDLEHCCTFIHFNLITSELLLNQSRPVDSDYSVK